MVTALGYDASVKGEELRKEREARARMDGLLNSIKEKGLTPEETIKVRGTPSRERAFDVPRLSDAFCPGA